MQITTFGHYQIQFSMMNLKNKVPHIKSYSKNEGTRSFPLINEFVKKIRHCCTYEIYQQFLLKKSRCFRYNGQNFSWNGDGFAKTWVWLRFHLYTWRNWWKFSFFWHIFEAKKYFKVYDIHVSVPFLFCQTSSVDLV